MKQVHIPKWDKIHLRRLERILVTSLGKLSKDWYSQTGWSLPRDLARSGPLHEYLTSAFSYPQVGPQLKMHPGDKGEIRGFSFYGNTNMMHLSYLHLHTGHGIFSDGTPQWRRNLNRH